MGNKHLLIVVDPQNDFIHPEGALAIDQTRPVFPIINNLLKSSYFDFKLITQDHHPSDHISFASTHHKEPYSTATTHQGGYVVEQMMWPNHCVTGTWGADFHEEIATEYAHLIVRKGYNSLRESYSLFEYVKPKGTPNKKEDQHPIYAMMENSEFDTAYICGFATDFCVADTARSALKIFKKVVIIADATKAVYPQKTPSLLEELNQQGIYVMPSFALIAAPK